MKNEKTIICHSFPAWDTPYVKSTVELMTRLTGEFRVIFVDYHYTLKDLFNNPYAPKKQIRGLRSRWRKVAMPQGDIEIFNTTPILPINWIKNKTLFKWMAKLNGLILKRQIKRLVKKNQLENSILVNAFNPIYGTETLSAWQSRKSFYYCYDEISGTDWSGKHGTDFEKKFLQMVDEVIVTSPKLLNTKSKFNNNTKLVPNGVNLDIFQPKIGTPHSGSIGYVGAIDNRIDVELINKLSEKFPEKTFDFYGPLKLDKDIFTSPNIQFHGAIPQEQLPEKISNMDVCLIPFIKNELTSAIYPLKANEYLAMGKPVVATNFADLSDFENIIKIAKDHLAFEEAVEASLTIQELGVQHDRTSFAQQNSWENRASSFASHLVA